MEETLLGNQRKAQLLQLKMIRLEKEISRLTDELDKTGDEFAEALTKLPPDWKQLDKNGLIITGC